LANTVVKTDSPALKKFKIAAEAGKVGNYRLAVKILGELITETDAPTEAWLLLGRSFHAIRDYSHALAAFNDYIRQRPHLGEGYFFVGRTYLSVGMPYRAVPFLRKALEKSPGKSSGFQAAEFKSKTKALLGTAYLKSRHSQAAVDIFQEAVEEAPEDRRIYRAYLNSLLVRGIRLCGTGNYELGIQMLRFVQENRSEAGLGESPLLRLELGRAARETGNLQEALEHFTAALKISGGKGTGDRRIRWSRASILMALGKTKEAIEEIEIIRSSDTEVPNLPWNSELVDLFMIKALLETGEWRRAAESCREWLKQREDKPIIHALFAEALRNLRNFKIAHNHLQRALEKEPKELDFWYADILVSWEGKNYKAVKKALRAAKALGGDKDLLARFDILCQSRTSDDTPGIITLLQNAIRSMGPEPELMQALAEAYLKVGLLEEALSWFKKTVELKEDHQSAWLGQIAALEALYDSIELSASGETNDSLESSASGGLNATESLASLYKSYLQRWPGNSSIRRDRALFLIKTLEYAEAALELEKLLVIEPSNPSLRRVLAYAYRKTGRYREAAVFLKALLKERPGDINILIEYSSCLERAGAGSYALELLEKARELFKNRGTKRETADISLALGILYYRQKKTEKAFDNFREAAAINRADPRPYEWMAAIARKYGEENSLYENEAKRRKNKAKA
jgi:tetratricopeptide (TPR) repeat protein